MGPSSECISNRCHSTVAHAYSGSVHHLSSPSFSKRHQSAAALHFANWNHLDIGIIYPGSEGVLITCFDFSGDDFRREYPQLSNKNNTSELRRNFYLQQHPWQRLNDTPAWRKPLFNGYKGQPCVTSDICKSIGAKRSGLSYCIQYPVLFDAL